MILELQERRCCGASERIELALATIDPHANVAINPVSGSVTVDGVLSKEQAIAALAQAGVHATPAHVGGGSDCCGGCS